MTLSCRRPAISFFSSGGKYFGDQPDVSMKTLDLWRRMAIISLCHGHEGWHAMMVRRGKSAAASSRWIGWGDFGLRPTPRGPQGASRAVDLPDSLLPLPRVDGGPGPDDRAGEPVPDRGDVIVGRRRQPGSGLRVPCPGHRPHAGPEELLGHLLVRADVKGGLVVGLERLEVRTHRFVPVAGAGVGVHVDRFQGPTRGRATPKVPRTARRTACRRCRTPPGRRPGGTS